MIKLAKGLLQAGDWIIAHGYDPECSLILTNGQIVAFSKNRPWGEIPVGQLPPGVGVAYMVTEPYKTNGVELMVVGYSAITDKLIALRRAALSPSSAEDRRDAVEAFETFCFSLLEKD
jgi:hypothetical protein